MLRPEKERGAIIAISSGLATIQIEDPNWTIIEIIFSKPPVVYRLLVELDESSEIIK